MSKGKKLIAAACALLVLIAATVALTIVRNNQDAAESQVEESSFYYAEETTLLSTHDKSEIKEFHVKNAEFEGTFTPYTVTEDNKEVQKWTWKENPDIITSVNDMANLASLGTALKLIKTIEDNQDHLENYGLDHPTAEVSFQYTDGKSETLSIGNATMDGKYCYAMISGRNDVFTIYKSIMTYATFTMSNLVHNDIPAIDREGTLLRLKLQERGGRLIDIRRKVEGEVREELYDTSAFVFESPYTYENAIVQGTIMDAYKNYAHPETHAIVAIARTEEEKAAYGLSKEDPVHYIEIEIASNKNGELTQNHAVYYYGNTDENGDVYMCHGDSPIVFAVRSVVLDNYDFNPFDYLQRIIYIAPIDAMSGFSVTSSENKLRYDVSVVRKEEEVSKEETAEASETSEAQAPEKTILEAWYVNGQLVDTAAAKKLYSETMGLMIDYDMIEKPEYDENAKVTVTFHRLDGKDVEINYYRLDEYYYAAEFGDIWVALNTMQFDSLWAKYANILQA